MIMNSLIAEKLRSDIDLIVSEILHFLDGEPNAILLCGGYGRGEGAWFKDNDGLYHPFNDYDIAVISEEYINNSSCNLLRKSLAERIGISWVDIDFYSLDYFKKLKCTIKNIDMLYGSTLVFGNFDYDSYRKEIQADKIGEFDIITLYQTRIWTFLGSFNGDFHDLSVEESRYFKNQMAKAILAACDMRLIKFGKYDSSYTRRVEMIHNLYPENKDLIELSDWALSEKLSPSSGMLTKNEMIDLYFKAKDTFLNALRTVIPLKCNLFTNPTVTKLYYIIFRAYFARNLYYFLRGDRTKYCKAIDVFLAQNYIFLSRTKSGVNERYLKHTTKILKKWDYITLDNISWNEARETAAFARNNL